MHLIIGIVIAGIIVLITSALQQSCWWFMSRFMEERRKKRIGMHLQQYTSRNIFSSGCSWEKVVLFISSEAERLILEALIEHYAVIINSTSDELEEITTNMTGVLDTADGPTILAHTDRMKLTRGEHSKERQQEALQRQRENEKLQGSDKLPHQTSTANRLTNTWTRKNWPPAR